MRRLGFTLLEVMVAVLILGIALVGIFASEVGAVKTAMRSNQMTVASLLARCKMAEIEEQVMREGLPAIDDSGSDRCCEDAEVEGFTCDWRIDRVVLPDDVGAEEEGAEGAEGAAPAGLPPGTRVAHKTGWITGVSHDAALIYPPGRKPYVLVVLTKGIRERPVAQKLIADISRLVWESIALPR